MKKAFLVCIFLMASLLSISAQDVIILRNGDKINAKVMEISPTEIKYKRFDNLDGPLVIIYTADVLAIQYENGTIERIIKLPAPAPTTWQESTPAKIPKTSSMNSGEFYIGINCNPGGALLNGTTFCIELGKGEFNTELNFIFPSMGGLANDEIDKGFGALITLNRFIPYKFGGFYYGIGTGFIWQQRYARVTDDIWYTEGLFNEYICTVGMNIGYKFIVPAGLYFRIGGYIGFAFGYYIDGMENLFYFKPDLALGWSF